MVFSNVGVAIFDSIAKLQINLFVYRYENICYRQHYLSDILEVFQKCLII